MSRFFWPMARVSAWTLSGLFATVILGLSPTAQAADDVFTDPAKAGFDYQVQGEYLGKMGGDTPAEIAFQIVARGDGKFDGVAYVGGFPGAGWNGEDPQRVSGSRDGETAVFEKEGIKGTWTGGSIIVTGPEGTQLTSLNRVERKSPTLGLKAPAGAVVLFDSKLSDAIPGAKLTDAGDLAIPITSAQSFGDCTVHVEFRTPFMPTASGQGRGNSGVYLQGRYEVQILDSFGNKPENNEAGAIYEVRAPLVNACLPPLVWQTYDIDYTAATYDAAGALATPPKFTVKQNGILVQQTTPVPGAKPTRAAPSGAGPTDGPLYIQDHGNPVVLRNVWVLPKAKE